MNETVESLRQKGYKVYVTHLRHFNLFHVTTDGDIAHPGELEQIRFTNKNDIPLELRKYMIPNGGETVVRIVKDGNVYIGTATCSDNDAFVKRHGYNAAFGRALGALANANTSNETYRYQFLIRE